MRVCYACGQSLPPPTRSKWVGNEVIVMEKMREQGATWAEVSQVVGHTPTACRVKFCKLRKVRERRMIIRPRLLTYAEEKALKRPERNPQNHSGPPELNAMALSTQDKTIDTPLASDVVKTASPWCQCEAGNRMGTGMFRAGHSICGTCRKAVA